MGHSVSLSKHLVTSPEIFQLAKTLQAHCLGAYHLEISTGGPLDSETDL